MSVRRDDGGTTILLVGKCPVEDAEPLLQLLQATPGAPLDWTQCGHLHTAVLQVDPGWPAGRWSGPAATPGSSSGSLPTFYDICRISGEPTGRRASSISPCGFTFPQSAL